MTMQEMEGGRCRRSFSFNLTRGSNFVSISKFQFNSSSIRTRVVVSNFTTSCTTCTQFGFLFFHSPTFKGETKCNRG